MRCFFPRKVKLNNVAHGLLPNLQQKQTLGHDQQHPLPKKPKNQILCQIYTALTQMSLSLSDTMFLFQHIRFTLTSFYLINYQKGSLAL